VASRAARKSVHSDGVEAMKPEENFTHPNMSVRRSSSK
jgi:hypothetical protein